MQKTHSALLTLRWRGPPQQQWFISIKWMKYMNLKSESVVPKKACWMWEFSPKLRRYNLWCVLSRENALEIWKIWRRRLFSNMGWGHSDKDEVSEEELEIAILFHIQSLVVCHKCLGFCPVPHIFTNIVSDIRSEQHYVVCWKPQNLSSIARSWLTSIFCNETSINPPNDRNYGM